MVINGTKYNFIFSIFIMCVLFYGFTTAETPIRKCASNEPLPLMVQMDNCTVLPCILRQDRNTHMAIQFVATKDYMSLINAEVRLTTLGAEISYKLNEEDSNVCENLLFGAYCPLYATEDVTYHLTMFINMRYTDLPMKIQVRLIDSTDESVVTCFLTDVRVKKW